MGGMGAKGWRKEIDRERERKRKKERGHHTSFLV